MKEFWLDSTKLGDFLKCPRSYYLRHIRNLTKDFVYFDFGSLIHESLFIWHGSQEHDLQGALDLWKGWLDREGDSKHTRVKGESMIARYAARYLREPWKLLTRERSFDLEFFSPSFVEFRLCGRLDGIIDHQGAILVIDYKTTSALGDSYFGQFDYPEIQMTLYILATQRIFGEAFAGTRILGAMVDALSKAETAGERRGSKTVRDFDRYTTLRSPEHLQRFELRLRSLFLEIYSREVAWERKLRPLDLCFPPNESSCLSRFGACMFRGACQWDLSEEILAQNYLVKLWDPREEMV